MLLHSCLLPSLPSLSQTSSGFLNLLPRKWTPDSSLSFHFLQRRPFFLRSCSIFPPTHNFLCTLIQVTLNHAWCLCTDCSLILSLFRVISSVWNALHPFSCLTNSYSSCRAPAQWSSPLRRHPWSVPNPSPWENWPHLFPTWLLFLVVISSYLPREWEKRGRRISSSWSVYQLASSPLPLKQHIHCLTVL